MPNIELQPEICLLDKCPAWQEIALTYGGMNKLPDGLGKLIAETLSDCPNKSICALESEPTRLKLVQRGLQLEEFSDAP